MEILFQFLVDPFCMSISLRVIGCGSCQLNSEQPVEFPDEFRYELGTSFPRGTMMFPHVVEEKVCGSSGRDHSDHGNEMRMLCDGIMSCRLWQLDNEVHADGIPWSRWNGKRVKFSGRRASEGFCPKAHVTGGDVPANIP